MKNLRKLMDCELEKLGVQGGVIVETPGGTHELPREASMHIPFVAIQASPALVIPIRP